MSAVSHVGLAEGYLSVEVFPTDSQGDTLGTLCRRMSSRSA